MLGGLVDPFLEEVFKSFLESMLRNIIYFKKRELMGETRLSGRDLHIAIYKNIKKSAPPRVRKELRVNEIIDGLESAEESTFDEFENFRKSLEKKLKWEKTE